MRPFASTISLEEARRRLAAAVQPIARTERVMLDRAAGRVAADAVISPIDVLSPGRVGALAAIGHADVEVFAKPRVAILSTGNEVIDPGAPLPPGHIYDINRFTLGAIVEAHGGIAEARHAAQDTTDALIA